MELFKRPKVFRFTQTQAFVFVLCLVVSSLYLGISVMAVSFVYFVPLPESLFLIYKSRFMSMAFLSFLNLAVSLGFLIDYLIQRKTIS